MSYGDFDLAGVREKFGLTTTGDESLFAAVSPAPLRPAMAELLADHFPLAVAQDTEKARSELLVAPLLAEVWSRSRHRVSVYSGVPFDVDAADGLTGVCDFLLGLSRQPLLLGAPVVAIVEAKRHALSDGLGQCAAAMVAALRFNERHGTPRETVYGAVTNGVEWRFLRLTGADLAVDFDQYLIAAPDKILGILLYCCGVSV